VYSSCVPVRLIDHPLAQDALVALRDRQTTPHGFRVAARRISMVVAMAALEGLPTTEAGVETPLESTVGRRVQGDVVVVPVLRAGLGMLDAVLELAPGARVGYLGLQRDETTAVASRYYAKLPSGSLSDSFVLMVDPMLATGGSAVAALDILAEAGAHRVRLACIVAAPEGIAHVGAHHPDAEIYTPAIDRALNARKYILPGLGDFGDRLYGTN
jgi:uracil phosphoribosyltransferase